MNVQFAATMRRMWSDGTYIADGDAGGLDADYQTLSESAMCLVDQCRVTYND